MDLKLMICESPKKQQHISSFCAGQFVDHCSNASLFPDVHVTTYTKNVLHQTYKPAY